MSFSETIYAGTLTASSILLSTPEPSFSGIMTLNSFYNSILPTEATLVSDVADVTTGLALDLSPKPTNKQFEGANPMVAAATGKDMSEGDGGLEIAAAGVGNGTVTVSTGYNYIFTPTSFASGTSVSDIAKIQEGTASWKIPIWWNSMGAAVVVSIWAVM